MKIKEKVDKYKVLLYIFLIIIYNSKSGGFMSNYSSPRLEKMLRTLCLPNKFSINDNAYIKLIINHYIKKALKDSNYMNELTDTIGFHSEINKVFPIITDLNDDVELTISNQSLWFGFIPKDIKIVYFFEIINNTCANQGYYYYLNDYNYLYDFANYIKNKKIINDISFLAYVHKFVYKYFSTFNKYIDRESLHHLILDSNEKFYKPIKEHNITDFKNRGAAMCSEYSALVQNILSVFGYQTTYIHGEIDKDNEKQCCHAFNLAVIDNMYSIIDSSIPIECFDIHNNSKTFPFIFCLNDFDDDDLEDFLLGNKELLLEDMDVYEDNNDYYTFGNNKQRVYRTDNTIFDECAYRDNLIIKSLQKQK